MPYELEEQEAIGRRIKRRRLGLGKTQADVAAALGKTQGWLSRVEGGRIELDRAALINQFAAVLHCHPNDLLGRPYVGTVEENRWQIAAAAVLRELRRYDLTPVFDGVPRGSGELWDWVRRLHRLGDAAAHGAALKELPDLFREARALAEVSTGHEREEAFAVYAVCCKATHSAGHALGHPELIAMATERAAWSAQLSGDPLMPAMASYLRAWDMWATADWDDSTAVLDRALADFERETDRGDQLALRMWGGLHLRAAVATARNSDPQESTHRIRLAREAAERVEAYEGPLVFDRQWVRFSSGNVTIHGVAVAVEAGDHVRALELNAEADQEQIRELPNSRRGHHHMDLARAWLWNGYREQALDELLKAERLAPQLIRNHPMARSTLRQIVYAERAATREKLRGMSSRFHLDDQTVFP
ncbi:helix-turn-helix transcriptional regulator [Streptomyces sp. BPTC-684]|uniref:helix-turn-helix domain-containing protein n=1 Tax=Streptomyces sp. BPTC-684 TaxID=3043734 RepID=UPI0024B20F1D|nr:helix-turn-helix transcriptional regulator [Streptomyces sp. BPTC-684]WHM37445.1 helix-turn-helix transcriptional regulator [Streptomyces sp. BPTC-684]